MSFTEANYENAVLEVFRDTLGYEYIYAPDLARDYSEPLYFGTAVGLKVQQISLCK